MVPRVPTMTSMATRSLTAHLRQIAQDVVRGRVFDDIELRHLVEVVRRCSLILHDLYAENEVWDLFSGRLPDSVLIPVPPGSGTAEETEFGLLHSLRETPDHVRAVADKCLYDVGLAGLDEYKGLNLSDLGVRTYRLASESLEQLADDRRLRKFFLENRWANLPLKEEIIFLQQCSDNFRCYTEILRHLRSVVEDGKSTIGGGATLAVSLPPVGMVVSAVPDPPEEKECGVSDNPSPPPKGESEISNREEKLADLERTLLFAGLQPDRLRDRLNSVVVDQNEAVETICDDLALRAAGTHRQFRPSSYLFVGPTGVGKNYLIESLIRDLEEEWKTRIPFLLLEGPQFTYPSDINDLKGATRGFIRSDEDGMLSVFHERAQFAPLSVLIVDEVEKAHPQLTRFFLSILDRGTTMDNRGRTLDFSRTLIVFTSNLGFGRLDKVGGSIGYQEKSLHKARREQIDREARSILSPEFLNRLKLIEFLSLSRESIERIFDLELKKIEERFRESQGVRIEVRPAARKALIELGFSAEFGARHLTAVMETRLTIPVTKKLLKDRVFEPIPPYFLPYLREIRQGRRAASMDHLEAQVKKYARGSLTYDRIVVKYAGSRFSYKQGSVRKR